MTRYFGEKDHVNSCWRCDSKYWSEAGTIGESNCYFLPRPGIRRGRSAPKRGWEFLNHVGVCHTDILGLRGYSGGLVHPWYLVHNGTDERTGCRHTTDTQITVRGVGKGIRHENQKKIKKMKRKTKRMRREKRAEVKRKINRKKNQGKQNRCEKENSLI